LKALQAAAGTLIAWLALTAGTAAPASAQSLLALAANCREDRQRLCPDVRPGGGEVAACLAARADELSEGCQAAIEAFRQTRDPALDEQDGLPDGTRIERDLAYGPASRQTLDVYIPPNAKSAPVLLIIHGGGWRLGDKASRGVVGSKAAYWLPKGFVVVSANYRMLPEADPMTQAQDVASALAYAQAHATEWGADPARFVLMGHSAGAHLAALLTAAPKIAYERGARPWLGTVSLDSGALNVPEIMKERHLPVYDKAFGADPDYWRRVSPLHRIDGTPRPMLLVCSSRRKTPCQEARQFAEMAGGHAGPVRVLPVAMSHMEINRKLGLPGDYSAKVDAFLNTLQNP
jgi:arylformamidase